MEKFKLFRKDIAVIFILLAVFITSAVFIGPIYGDILKDCGREVMLPEWVLKGNVLYKDIFAMYNPLPYLINALMYKCIGSSINTIYFLSYANSFLILVGIYGICRVFINEFYSFAFVLTVMSFFIFGNTDIVSYIFPYAFAFPYAVTFLTYSVLAFLIYMKNSNVNFAYLSFLLLGCSLACKPEFALCALVLIIAMLYNKEKALNIVLSVVLFIIPTILSYLVLFVQGMRWTDFSSYISFLYKFFNTSEQIYYTTAVMKPWNLENIKYIFETSAPFFVLMAAGAVYFSLFFKNIYMKLIGIVLIPCYITLNMDYLSEYDFINHFGWSIFALLGILYVKCNKINTLQDKMLLGLSILGILTMARINFLPIAKFGFGIYSILPILAVWVYFVLSDFFEKHNCKKYIAFTLIVLSLSNIAFVKSTKESFVKIETSKGSLYAESARASLFNNLIQWVNENTQPNDTILVLPEGVLLNYVTGRKTLPKYYHLVPNHIAALGEENIVTELEKQKPDYLIFNNLVYKEYGLRHICDDFGFGICKFAEDNYKMVDTQYAYDTSFNKFNVKIYKLKK